MEKLIIDERTGWEYELNGDYYYPTGRVMRNGLLTPETIDNDPEKEQFIGVWGQRHLRFIRQHKYSLYLDLFMSGKLNAYLADINAQAESFFFRVVKDMASKEGVTEHLKATNQMEWTARMNNIHNRAMETVNNEYIFIEYRSD